MILINLSLQNLQTTFIKDVVMRMNKKILIGGIIVALAFLSFSFSIQHSEAIWIQTRIFGLVSFFALFTTVLFGELRLLHKVKGDFGLFRFHKPIAIFSIFLVLLHFISAAFDRFKWGVNLRFTDYLGFAFSDKWLILLSLGTLAFYLLLVIGFTSANRSMQFLGFKRWKVIHFLSYVAFVVAYIHSMNLGTDLKLSVLAPILHPLILVMFLSVTSLFIARLINATTFFEDQKEVVLGAIFFLLLIIGSVFFVSILLEKQTQLDDLSLALSASEPVINVGQELIDNRTMQIQSLEQELWRIKNGQVS
jgi:methionine sulfoxide reductase heme-binding subunit